METKLTIYTPFELAATMLVVFRQFDDGRISVFGPHAQEDGSVTWKWEEIPEGQTPEPTMVIPRAINADGSLLQQLANKLSEEGVWPKGMEAQALEVKRLEGHLEDLRRLVFESDWTELQRGRPQAQFIKEREADDAKV